MIDHPKTFLLKKVMYYDRNGLDSLGHLPATFFDDISKVLEDYAVEAVNDIVTRIAKKEIKIKMVK